MTNETEKKNFISIFKKKTRNYREEIKINFLFQQKEDNDKNNNVKYKVFVFFLFYQKKKNK